MRRLALLLLAVSLPAAAQVRTGDEIALWPGTPPGSAGLAMQEVVNETSKDAAVHNRTWESITRPTLTAFVPEHPNGTAMIVAPGGRYMRVWADKEGADIGRMLSARGVSAFVLKYRLPHEGHADGGLTPIQDGQRAIRIVRAHAASWGIDPARIGAMGFSAGGHLAAMLGSSQAPAYAAQDAVDSLSARPDFIMLLYPVITMDERYAHADSRRMLIGEHPDAAAVAAFSPEIRAGADAPPAFIAVANDDQTVDPTNSLLFYQALRTAGVSAELHVFAHGGHGFAADATQAGSEWPDLAMSWMQRR